jgi:hypothetical protein
LSGGARGRIIVISCALQAPDEEPDTGSVTNVAAGLGSLLSARYLVSDEGGALHGFPTLAWINIACTLVACAGVWFLIRGLKSTRDNNNPASGTARQGSQ